MHAPILVIEDDPDILSTVADILEFVGYTVQTATNGREGLILAEQFRPRAVVLDMRMPVLNGWEFARAARQRGLNLPVLVMTAAPNAQRWAEEIGAQGYLPKPFHIDELVTAVAALAGPPEGTAGPPGGAL